MSQDYGVAAMALGKGCHAIHQSGKWYTNENIDQMLMERHLAKNAKRSSKKDHLKGPAKRTPEDDQRFEESFERMISKGNGFVMKYKVLKIDEDIDFGREERKEGEPLMVVVRLEDENGTDRRLQVCGGDYRNFSNC